MSYDGRVYVSVFVHGVCATEALEWTSVALVTSIGLFARRQ
jgi:hypothetical protein